MPNDLRPENGRKREDDGAQQKAASQASSNLSREANDPKAQQAHKAQNSNVPKEFGSLELTDSAKQKQNQDPQAQQAGRKFDRNNVHRDFKGRQAPEGAANEYKVKEGSVQPRRVNCTRPKAPDPSQCRSMDQYKQQGPQQGQAQQQQQRPKGR